MADPRTLDQIAEQVVARILGEGHVEDWSFPVGVSNRHIHLQQDHLETLFGPGAQLTVRRRLVQPGQFAAEETLLVAGPRGALRGVRVIGPVRKQTQVELSRTDCLALGLDAPLRVSGDLSGSAGCVLSGPKGSVVLSEGAIVAARHIHLEPGRARRLGVRDRQMAQVLVGGERGLVFDRVIIRAGEAHMSEVHFDTDEANAAGLENRDTVTIRPLP